MKKIFYLMILVIIFTTFLFSPFFKREIILEKEKIGYCPTMVHEAFQIAERKNYELIQFNSASEVLLSLNKNQIDYALIGRKPYSYEINGKIKEEILKSGKTLVSNEKRLIDISQLNYLRINTYLTGLDDKNIVYYESKEEALERINHGEIVLISWEDWGDDFELIVPVYPNREQVKEFRGVFLYSYS